MSKVSITTIENKLRNIADFYGQESQLNQTVEECGELVQAIAKYNRAAGRGYDTNVTPEEAKEHLIEELADVQMMVCQMVYLLHCEKTILDKINEKADRQIERMDLRHCMTEDCPYRTGNPCLLVNKCGGFEAAEDSWLMNRFCKIK